MPPNVIDVNDVSAAWERRTVSRMNPEQARALIVTGRLGGDALQLNVEELEKYLENPVPDFAFKELCRLSIDFARAVRRLKMEDAYTIS